MVQFTDSQLEALCVLADDRGYSAIELAEKLGIKRPNISSEIVAPLTRRCVIYETRLEKTGEAGRPRRPLHIFLQSYQDIFDEVVNLQRKYCEKIHEKGYKNVLFDGNGEIKVEYDNGIICNPEKDVSNIIKKHELYNKARIIFGYWSHEVEKTPNKLIIATPWSPYSTELRKIAGHNLKKKKKKSRDVRALRAAHEAWINPVSSSGDLLSCDDQGLFSSYCIQCGRKIASRIDDNFILHIRCSSCGYENTTTMQKFEVERATFKDRISNML